MLRALNNNEGKSRLLLLVLLALSAMLVCLYITLAP